MVGESRNCVPNGCSCRGEPVFWIKYSGQTFDPIDIIMYTTGVLTASLMDWIFSIIFKFWKTEMKEK